jgi:hypothetical protein
MMSPDMTDAAIAERLESLGRLHSLGLSLAGAARLPLPETVFHNRCLAIESRASTRAREAVATGLVAAPGINDVLLFLSYAGTTHAVGSEFDVIVDGDGSLLLAEVRMILVGLTQQFGKPWDEIPGGWKTLGVIRFVGGVPEVIASLAEADAWGSPIVARVARRADWERFSVSRPP